MIFTIVHVALLGEQGVITGDRKNGRPLQGRSISSLFIKMSYQRSYVFGGSVYVENGKRKWVSSRDLDTYLDYETKFTFLRFICVTDYIIMLLFVNGE